MNIIKTANKIKVLGVKDFIISLMEDQIAHTRLEHLKKNRAELIRCVVYGLTTQRKGGKTYYSQRIEEMINQGEKDIRTYNIVPYEKLRELLCYHDEITQIMELIKTRLQCSDDMMHYYYFNGVKPCMESLVMSLTRYGHVSWRDCRRSFYDALDNIAEESQHLVD